MESALMRVPPSLSASASASADFPLAVGPAISTAPMSAARVMCYRIPNRSSWPGLTRPSTPWLMHKDVDARVQPAHDAAEAPRELARMEGWGGGCPANSTTFPCNIIRVTLLQCRQLYACKLPSLVVEQTRNKTSPAQGMMPSRPALQGRHYPFLPSRVSHKISYNHLATFSANPHTNPTSANEPNEGKANNIKQFQS